MRVGITGHRELPPDTARQVRSQLAAAVGEYAGPAGELVAVSCLADGPDSWFAECVLARGGSLEAVLPADDYRTALPEGHRPDLDALLDQASQVHRTGLALSDSHAFMTAGELMLDQAESLLAVWDGQPARGPGGTADVVAAARERGMPVRVIWSESACRG
ncbi:MAG TPA: hypothetical protein DEQ61_05490 [Streptomyces sp.]|nr:hypothetical protein [Streptomyces sp.]